MEERERRWDELLPGVGRCHGVPSGNSIVGSSITECQWEGVYIVKLKVAESIGLKPVPTYPSHPTGMYRMCPVCVMDDWQVESIYSGVRHSLDVFSAESNQLFRFT